MQNTKRKKINSELFKEVYHELFDSIYNEIPKNISEENKKIFSENINIIKDNIFDIVYETIKKDYEKNFDETFDEIYNINIEEDIEKSYVEIKNKIYKIIKNILDEKLKDIMKEKIIDEINIKKRIKIKEEDKVSLGINIGSLNTVYSIFGKKEGRFQTNVLLSDVSKRTIPSQICYSDTHRLYGDTASSLMKKYNTTSYSNLSRLIGFKYNLPIFQNEINSFFYYGSYFKESNHFKYFNNYYLNSENIIADYISLINHFFFQKEKIEYDYTIICVPDYYLIYQKEEIRIILESLKMKKINIINESTALTMYYGYTKYRDMFVFNKNKISNINLIKNVIFIDIGYSKTQIIYSTFSYMEFKVINVDSLPLIGGRNFNNIIMEYCLCDFKKKNNLNDNIIINEKSKLRLLEAIEKGRKALSINNEINILVESFFHDIDLEYFITKEKFEEMISNEILIIKNFIIEFKKNTFENNILPKNLSVEISGELMRTPILQNLIKEIFNIEVSKTLLIDECLSVGSSIFGYYINKKIPINTFNKFYFFNNYQIFCFVEEMEKEFLIKDYDCDNFKEYFFQINCTHIQNFKELNLNYYYKMKYFHKCFIDSYLLFKYKINLNLLKKKNKNFNFDNDNFKIIFSHFFINNFYDEYKFQIKIYFLNGNLIGRDFKGNISYCDYDDCISLQKQTFLSENDIEDKKNNIFNFVSKNQKIDDLYFNYACKKNELSKLIYSLKNQLLKFNGNKKEEFKIIISEEEKKIKSIEKEINLSVVDKSKKIDEIKNKIEELIEINL